MGEKETLRQIKKKLEEEIEVEQVFLFGSRVRGTHKEDSDYDIAVLSEDFEGLSRQERYMKIIGKVRQVLEDQPVDLACYTPEEFEKGKDSFLPSIIEEEGISV